MRWRREGLGGAGGGAGGGEVEEVVVVEGAAIVGGVASSGSAWIRVDRSVGTGRRRARESC